MKKFISKLTIFVVLLCAIQFFVAAPVKFADAIDYLDYFLGVRGSSVVYFGDSTTTWASPKDKSQISMQGVLQLLMPAELIVQITYPSFNMDVYVEFCNYIVRKGYHPEIVIIPINLRSFSPGWDRLPHWQFEREKWTARMKDTWAIKFYKPLSVFKLNESRISEQDYLNTKVYNGDQYMGRVSDFENPFDKIFLEDSLKNKMMFHYMYPLSREHRKIRSLVRIAETLNAAGIKGIFYITPIDYESGVAVLGKTFAERVAQNVGVIDAELSKHGIKVLDFSVGLGTKSFSWPQEEDPFSPDEHLTLSGRTAVVGSIYREIVALRRKR